MFKVLLVLAAMLEIVYIVHPLTIVNNVILASIKKYLMVLAINVMLVVLNAIQIIMLYV